MAIFEYLSSNGSSFNLLYECRGIKIRDIGDVDNNNFSYLVDLPDQIKNETSSCAERGYEDWEAYSRYCITSFQG